MKIIKYFFVIMLLFSAHAVHGNTYPKYLDAEANYKLVYAKMGVGMYMDQSSIIPLNRYTDRGFSVNVVQAIFDENYRLKRLGETETYTFLITSNGDVNMKHGNTPWSMLDTSNMASYNQLGRETFNLGLEILLNR